MKDETKKQEAKANYAGGVTLREELEEALRQLDKNADVSMGSPGYRMANDKLAQWARKYGRRFCTKLLEVVKVAEAEMEDIESVED